MRGTALLFLFFAIATPVAAHADPVPEPAADSLIATKWELKKPVARSRSVVRRSIASRPRRVTNVSQPRPRIIGGATAGSAQHRGPNAKVGIALPF